MPDIQRHSLFALRALGTFIEAYACGQRRYHFQDVSDSDPSGPAPRTGTEWPTTAHGGKRGSL